MKFQATSASGSPDVLIPCYRVTCKRNGLTLKCDYLVAHRYRRQNTSARIKAPVTTSQRANLQSLCHSMDVCVSFVLHVPAVAYLFGCIVNAFSEQRAAREHMI